MFVAVSEFTVSPENHAAFEEHFGGSMKNTLVGVPGLVRSVLLRGTGRTPDRGYMALMEFEDKAAYDAYVSSEAFRASHAGPRQSIASGFSAGEFESVLELTD